MKDTKWKQKEYRANKNLVNDLVDGKRIRFDGGLKLKPRYLDPHRII